MTAAKIDVSEEGVTLFKDSPNHGVKYSVFTGDDHDSSTIAKIHKEVAYSVEKWSDSTHATRILVSPLHKIRSENSSSPGESVLSQKVIDYFQKCFRYCLNHNIEDSERNEYITYCSCAPCIWWPQKMRGKQFKLVQVASKSWHLFQQLSP